MIKYRILSTVLLASIAAASLFFDPLFIIVIALLTFGGLTEYFAMIEKKGVPVYKYFGTIVGLIIPLSIFFKFELTKGWELFFVVIGLISLFVLQIAKRNTTQAVFSISTTLFGVVYVSWLFSFIVKIKMLPAGSALLGALIFITKGSDIGAYLIGSRFGRHAFIKEISPKKSLEGLAGGIIFGMLAALASASFLPQRPEFSSMHLLFIGFSLSLLSLVGDLSESLIKRDCLAKDASDIFPGIGGVLDVLDSLLFTAPAFYFYLFKYVRQM